ncbi:MAG: hypothetical protein M2R45_04103 [Verrucomicrobia subdivision 3 bacterium]|nr:hypothetical protein [Limisphaerales bacterium]MCS1417096.1 hypothetical protein [Limisphaerales bacterium]
MPRHGAAGSFGLEVKKQCYRDAYNANEASGECAGSLGSRIFGPFPGGVKPKDKVD